MMTLTIQSKSGDKPIIKVCDRFTSSTYITIKDNLYIEPSTLINKIQLNSKIVSLFDAYTRYINERIIRLVSSIKQQQPRVSTINGLSGTVFILAGRGIAVEQWSNDIGLCNTMYNTLIDKKISNNTNQCVVSGALQNIMRYQLCIYHYLNMAVHRSLTTVGSYKGNGTYGSYLRYLSIKARWNHYVFMSGFNCSVVGGSDNLSISVGLNNIFTEALDGAINVHIKPLGESNFMIWHGIFLEQTSTLDTNSTNNKSNYNDEITVPQIEHVIKRNGGYIWQLKSQYYSDRWENIEIGEIEADYDQLESENEDSDTSSSATTGGEYERKSKAEAFLNRVFYPRPLREGGSVTDHNNPSADYIKIATPEDITNPNACMWSIHGGKWDSGDILIPNIPLKPLQSFKQVYSIARHPAIAGKTKRDGLVNFDIKIVFKLGEYEVTRNFRKVPCYMQCPDTSDGESGDGSTDKMYILTATPDMSVYIDPSTT